MFYSLDPRVSSIFFVRFRIRHKTTVDQTEFWVGFGIGADLAKINFYLQFGPRNLVYGQSGR